MGIPLIEYTPQQTKKQTVATRLASIKHLPQYVWYIAYIYIYPIYILRSLKMNKLIRWAPYMSFPLSSTGCPANLTNRPPAPIRLPDVLC